MFIFLPSYPRSSALFFFMFFSSYSFFLIFYFFHFIFLFLFFPIPISILIHFLLFILFLLFLSFLFFSLTAKHSGQLKRISITTINLLSFLLTLETRDDDVENIFYERFIQLSVDELVKINFFRHIGITKEKGKVSTIFFVHFCVLSCSIFSVIFSWFVYLYILCCLIYTKYCTLFILFYLILFLDSCH